MPRRRIRILAHHQHPDAGQRLPESPQQVWRRRQHAMPGGHLAGEEGQGFPHLRLYRRQWFRPVRSNQLAQRPARQVREAGAAGGSGSSSNSASASKSGSEAESNSELNTAPILPQVPPVPGPRRMTTLSFGRSMGTDFYRVQPVFSESTRSVSWPKQRKSTCSRGTMQPTQPPARAWTGCPQNALSARDQQMLALERQWWEYAGAKGTGHPRAVDLVRHALLPDPQCPHRYRGCAGPRSHAGQEIA